MRKGLIGALCLLICWLPVLAGAESTGTALIFTGKVEAKETVTVYAPFGGPVKDFTLRVGDRVEKGEALLSIDTGKVYAPCDGTVRGIFAEVGDTASFVQSRYGALCYIEPTAAFTVRSAISQGFDSVENRFLHIGEPVYLDSTNSSDREGVGRITSVEGESYKVEVISGSLELRDNVNIYRDAALAPETRIGRGAIERQNPVAVTGDGAVLSIVAEDGAAVKRGDLLFEVVTGTLDGMASASPTLYAPEEGIVASVAVSAGQSVGKNQAVVTLDRLERLQLACTVSELDAQEVVVGGRVSITFDGIPGTAYDGVIDSVSGIGAVSDNYTEYSVYIDFTPDESIRLGMSGAAYPVD